MKPYFETELGKLYKGDCAEVMKQLNIKVDLVLTDPPYGINACKGTKGIGTSANRKYFDNWDNSTPTAEQFTRITNCAKNAIIFGGNYFTDMLPQNNKWFVWDKACGLPNETDLSDCELIYTNIKGNNVKRYQYRQMGFISHEKERYHPTQKPVNLIKALLEDYSKSDDLILDCYSGSGTTAIACEQLGRKWICIEKEQKYCDITIARLKEIQQTLF